MMKALEIIRSITADKRRRRIVPEHATRREIMEKYPVNTLNIDAELEKLVENFTVTECRTLNDTAYLMTEL